MMSTWQASPIFVLHVLPDGYRPDWTANRLAVPVPVRPPRGPLAWFRDLPAVARSLQIAAEWLPNAAAEWLPALADRYADVLGAEQVALLHGSTVLHTDTNPRKRAGLTARTVARYAEYGWPVFVLAPLVAPAPGVVLPARVALVVGVVAALLLLEQAAVRASNAAARAAAACPARLPPG